MTDAPATRSGTKLLYTFAPDEKFTLVKPGWLKYRGQEIFAIGVKTDAPPFAVLFDGTRIELTADHMTMHAEDKR